LAEAKPEDLVYTFSEFHKVNQNATIDKEKLSNSVTFYVPNTSDKDVNNVLSGSIFNVKHMDNFLQNNK
jgi:hypothetical protein